MLASCRPQLPSLMGQGEATAGTSDRAHPKALAGTTLRDPARVLPIDSRGQSRRALMTSAGRRVESSGAKAVARS